MARKGICYIISAPSGGGKTTLIQGILQSVDNMCFSVSHTTRACRPGEQDGVDYHFIAADTFKQMLNDGVFLEYAEVFGHYYGTSKHWVEQQLNAGMDVILELDWQGARQIRRVFPTTVSVFLLPPSRKDLLRRLQQRQQDPDEVISARMSQARSEMSHYKEYDYLIINDDFQQALADLQTIIRAQRLSLPAQLQTEAELLATLL